MVADDGGAGLGVGCPRKKGMKWIKRNEKKITGIWIQTTTTTKLDSASLHCPAAIPFPRDGHHLSLNFNAYSRDLMFRCASLISTLIEKNKNKWNYWKRKSLLAPSLCLSPCPPRSKSVTSVCPSLMRTHINFHSLFKFEII